MSPAQQILDYRKEIDENQKMIREMVMESYRDISAGKGRGCNEFFNELEKRYLNVSWQQRKNFENVYAYNG